jgi:hypothetical protein
MMMMDNKERYRAELDNDTQSDVVGANLNFNPASSSLWNILQQIEIQLDFIQRNQSKKPEAG